MKRLFTTKQTQARYGISRASLYRWQTDPRVLFPAPIKIGHRIYWCEGDLNSFDQKFREAAGGRHVD